MDERKFGRTNNQDHMFWGLYSFTNEICDIKVGMRFGDRSYI